MMAIYEVGMWIIPLDVFGNAAAMDVFKFLSLPLNEKFTVLDGFEQQDHALKTLITHAKLNFDTLSTEFLKIKVTDHSVKTDHLVKQVYFQFVKHNIIYSLF
jgi:CRISPR-associated protein Csy1